MADNTLVSFDCGICLERTQALPKNVRRISSESDDQVCSDCAPHVLQRFNLALTNEIDYPPKWGGEEIAIELWSDLLGKKFMKQWDKKVSEYACPVQHRTYCQNKVLVAGHDSKNKAGHEFCNNYLPVLDPSKLKERIYCRVCRQWTCVACKCPAGSSLEAKSHVCSHEEDSSQREAFDEGTRGKEWQQCPNRACAVKVDLRDGCNAMDCAFCGSSFCFLCGEEAEHNGDHWTRGKSCPRWGAADAADPMFDPVRQADIEVEAEGGQLVVVNAANFANDFPLLNIARRAFNSLLRSLRLEIRVLGLEHALAQEVPPATLEQRWVPPAMSRILSLVEDLVRNLDHIIVNWAVNDAPEAERQAVDPIQMAVAASNFMIRDHRVRSEFVAAYDAALLEAKEDSTLHGMSNFARALLSEYIDFHWPGYDRSQQRIDNALEADRELWFVGTQEELDERQLLRERMRARARLLDEALLNRG